MFDFLRTASAKWRSREFVVTPELLGSRKVRDCQERDRQLGLTPLPQLPYRQELDILLQWPKKNGFDQLPVLAHGTNRN